MIGSTAIPETYAFIIRVKVLGLSVEFNHNNPSIEQMSRKE